MRPIRFLPKIQRGKECLNCGLPLAGEENFCPNCGQRNDSRKLNFGNFLSAVFSEFISYDSRLWRTILAMLIYPGKVSREYIDGKRFRYVNPFRFYLTVSIVFFVLIGLINKYEDFKDTGKSKTPVSINTTDVLKKIDSIKKTNPDNKDLEKSIVINKNKTKSVDNDLNIDSLPLGKNSNALIKKITRYNQFYTEHKTLPVEQALDGLGEPQTFWNRFYYSKIDAIYKSIDDGGNSLNKKIMSNLSIALFIFLPIFTLFLKLLYVRRHLNYMEHLIFVFNTQTVFFLLMTILLLLNFIAESPSAPVIFVLMFIVYLYLALLKFYKQGWFKTFVKFCILNMIYLSLSAIGLIIVSILAFLIG